MRFGMSFDVGFGLALCGLWVEVLGWLGLGFRPIIGWLVEFGSTFYSLVCWLVEFFFFCLRWRWWM